MKVRVVKRGVLERTAAQFIFDLSEEEGNEEE